jgi:hypothetical protein
VARKKKFLVMPRNPRAQQSGLQTSKGLLKFGRKAQGLYVSDPGLVDEIDNTYGVKGNGDVWTHEDERVESWDANDRDDRKFGGVHNYTFPGIRTPWRKKKWVPRDDPDWEEYAPGKWREKPQRKRTTRGAEPEATDSEQ